MASDSSRPVSCLMILKNELLLGAVARGELPTVRRLLDRHRADVNTHNPSGMSSLQIAIVGRHHKLADYLIQKGVELHSKDSQGWNALHDASLMDSPGMVRKLIAKGVSPTCTTHLCELPIDLAGSVQMENLLCEEMCEQGETSLARQYYVYLGLDRLNNTSQSSQQQQQHQPSHFNRNISNGASRGANSTARVQKHAAKPHPSSGHSNGSARSRDNHAVSKKVKFSANLVESGSHITTESLQASAIPSRAKLEEVVIESPPTTRKSRPDINSLYQHTGFQFEIGLSLQQQSTPFTALDSGPLARKDECNIVSASYPPPLLTERKTYFDSPRAVRTQSQATPPLVRTSSGILRRETPRSPRRTVSFSELPPMTRKKYSFDGSSSSSRRATTTGTDVKKASATSSTLEELSAELISQLSDIYDDSVSSTDQQNDSDETSPTEDAVALLKMKPRKPSIVSPARRKSGEMRRRSVTFPPEVLLQVMVTDGDSKGVSEMLESGAVSDVNVMSPAGLTALHQSAVDGNLECAKALVGSGAKINCVDCEKWTPLHAAVVQGHVEFVRFLLQAGANPTMKNEEGDTPYNIAKHKAIRKMLLHAMNGKSLDADDFSDGEYSGEEEEEEYSHAESDSEDDESGSALFDSSSENKPSLKERLGLNHSAALKNTHDNSVSPSPDFESSDSVFISGPAISPVSRKERTLTDSTSSYGSLNEPEAENSKEKSSSNKDKNSHKAGSNSVEDVGYSDTDKISEDQGISTMDGSSDCSHRSRILSEDEGTSRDGIDRELVPGSVSYKFQEACLKCDVDTLLKLIRYKSDIEVDRVNDTSGITVLHHAVLEENPAFVQHLVVDFGASVHSQDRDGWTPLHAASAVGNIRIAQFLLENGAKASVLNKSCEFPVDVAEDQAMERLLKNVMLGSNVSIPFTR